MSQCNLCSWRAGESLTKYLDVVLISDAKLGSTGRRYYICFISAWTKITSESAGNPSESAGFPSNGPRKHHFEPTLAKTATKTTDFRDLEEGTVVTALQNNYGNLLHHTASLCIWFSIYTNPVIQSFDISIAVLELFVVGFLCFCSGTLKVINKMANP